MTGIGVQKYTPLFLLASQGEERLGDTLESNWRSTPPQTEVYLLETHWAFVYKCSYSSKIPEEILSKHTHG